MHTGIWEGVRNPSTQTGYQHVPCRVPQEARRQRELPLWLPQKGLGQGEQGSDGLGGITSRLPGLGLSLTDALPTDDYRQEIPK